MRRSASLQLAALVAVAACERRHAPDPRAMVQKTMQGVLAYPQSVPVDVAAGEDAAQLTLTTTDSVGTVADWFRQVLILNGWTLQSDVAGPGGTISIAAQRGNQPLWIMLQPNAGAPGTTYRLVGAVVRGDSMRARDSVK